MIVDWVVGGTSDVGGDWIGLYQVGSANNQYVAWIYTGSVSGSYPFTLNTAGQYEVRYFVDAGYTDVETSPTITVIDSGTPTYADPGGEPDGTAPSYTVSVSTRWGGGGVTGWGGGGGGGWGGGGGGGGGVGGGGGGGWGGGVGGKDVFKTSKKESDHHTPTQPAPHTQKPRRQKNKINQKKK